MSEALAEKPAKVVRIDGGDLIGHQAFHAAFAGAFGFFDGYGRNMDAWIDCMSYLRYPESGMVDYPLGKGELVTIFIKNWETFREADAGLAIGLLECAAMVNRRYIEDGEPPVLALAI